MNLIGVLILIVACIVSICILYIAKKQLKEAKALNVEAEVARDNALNDLEKARGILEDAEAHIHKVYCVTQNKK